jgi:CheY-like chemotaxis protein
VLDSRDRVRAAEQCVAPKILPACRRALTILLAEDNRVNQMVATALLKKAGHTITLAETGTAVLEAVAKQDFDLVLMDVQMPEMDGIAATMAIRQSEKGTGKHLHIIAMTANAMIGDKEHCLQSGMDGYLAKPLSGKALYGAIEAIPVPQTVTPSGASQVRLSAERDVLNLTVAHPVTLT